MTKEARTPRIRAPQQEKPPKKEGCALQLERARRLQQRPSTAKNEQLNFSKRAKVRLFVSFRARGSTPRTHTSHYTNSACKEETGRKTCSLPLNSIDACQEELLLLDCSGRQETEAMEGSSRKTLQFKIKRHF